MLGALGLQVDVEEEWDQRSDLLSFLRLALGSWVLSSSGRLEDLPTLCWDRPVMIKPAGKE